MKRPGALLLSVLLVAACGSTSGETTSPLAQTPDTGPGDGNADDGDGSGPVDITDALLTSRSADCADYVAAYECSVRDVNRDLGFTGPL